ncbi:hypothetical protein D3C73_1484350 [compost metagenome]
MLKCGKQLSVIKAIGAGIDLAYRIFFRSAVLLFNDLQHIAVFTADNPSIARRLVHYCRQN